MIANVYYILLLLCFGLLHFGTKNFKLRENSVVFNIMFAPAKESTIDLLPDYQSTCFSCYLVIVVKPFGHCDFR